MLEVNECDDDEGVYDDKEGLSDSERVCRSWMRSGNDWINIYTEGFP